jgi:SAM-dependent methyltransferase
MQDPSWKRFLRKRAALVGTTDGWYCGLLRRLCSFPVHQQWFLKGNVSFSSRILDIGCGSGALLVRIWKEGFTGATGIDPYIPADIRYKNGLEIRKVTIGEFGPDGTYDFIMMNHSFEHIPAQHAAFADIARLLAPGGTALVRVPVSGSYAWERYGTDWVHLEAPRHLYLHTEKSMAVLAREVGLELKDVVYDSDELQFYGSELLKDGLIKNVRDYKEYMKEHSETAFTRAQMRAWKKESERLNGIKKGDQACFYLGRP